jgi:hypothetical protein
LIADRLIAEYGISFLGFKKDIPKGAPPRATSSENLILIPLPNKKGYVHDGFFHSAIIEPSRNRAWIHRIGGFPSVNEWYGPITVNGLSFEGCRIEVYNSQS